MLRRLGLGAAVAAAFAAVLLPGAVAPSRAYASAPPGMHWRPAEMGWDLIRDDNGKVIGHMTDNQFSDLIRAEVFAQDKFAGTPKTASSLGLSTVDEARGTEVMTVGEASSPESAGDLAEEAAGTGFLSGLSGALMDGVIAAPALSYGFEIGSSLIGYFDGPEIAEPTAGEYKGYPQVAAVSVRFSKRGANVVETGYEQYSYHVANPAFGLVVQFGRGGEDREPGDGYLVRRKNCKPGAGTEVSEVTAESYDTPWLVSGSYPYDPPPGEVKFVEGEWEPWPEGSPRGSVMCEIAAAFYWQSLHMHTSGSQSEGASTLSASSASPGASEAEAGVRSELESPYYGALTGAVALEDSELMPDVVVPEPSEGELYSQYDSELEEIGLKPSPQVLPEVAIDPSVGPEAVVDVRPDPGTEVERASEVEVQYNPANAPQPSGSSWSPPSIGSPDLSPLEGISPCGVFPFGLLCWFGEAIEQVDVTPACPDFNIPVPWQNETINGGLELCAEPAEEIMTYVRPAELFAFVVALGFLFARSTRAIGDD